MKISEDQAKIYSLLSDVIMRFLLGWSVALVFIFYSAAFLFYIERSLQTSFVQVFLTGTMFQVFKYYFPTKLSAESKK